MRSLLALIILTPVSGLAQFADRAQPVVNQQDQRKYNQDEAFNITTDAAMKVPEIKSLVKRTEDWTWKRVESIGLSKDICRTTATIAAPIIAGKISTRGLHIHWEPWKNVQLRPDVDYYFKTKDYGIAFAVNWRF